MLSDARKQPLALVERLSALLLPIGRCQHVYATAEFQPFSSAFKPDLLLCPTRGPRRDQYIFMEFTRTFRGFEGQPVITMLEERRSFVRSYLEHEIDYYIVFTELAIDEFSKSSLANNRIYLAAYSENEGDVIEALKSLDMISS